MADNNVERKSGKLMSVTPQLENGVHEKYKDSFKFIVVLDNGDSSTAMAKSAVAPWQIGKTYNYSKKSGTNARGYWSFVTFDKDEPAASSSSSASGEARPNDGKSKIERILELKMQCLIACSNVFQGAGALSPEMKDAYKEMLDLIGMNILTDGIPVAPTKKFLTDDAKQSMINYLKSNKVENIASVVTSIADYDVSPESLIEICSALVKPF